MEKPPEDPLDEKIIVAPGGLCDWKDVDYVSNLVFKNLSQVGIKVKNIEVKREGWGYFEATHVNIYPTSRRIIRELKLGLQHWTVKVLPPPSYLGWRFKPRHKVQAI